MPHPDAPVCLIPPEIVGSGIVGVGLLGHIGHFGGEPPLRYKIDWVVDNVCLHGIVSGCMYIPHRRDVGHAISLKVEALNAFGKIVVTSSPPMLIQEAPK
jgi:hypothetical protein